MPAVPFTPPRPAPWSDATNRALSVPWTRVRVVVLACATLLAAAIRVGALDTYGFSEDEINKVQAIEQYRAGRFGVNAEHPMLMKVAMWGSAAIFRSAPRETALRLPNAIAGAATTALMFGVADVLFGAPAALVAAAIWAFDPNAIAISRIGKEDTFLLCFFLLAVWCYERAKQIGAIDTERARRWYTASGAAFGLMLASKYMPQLLGIYALFNALTDPEPGANRPRPLFFYGAMAAAFLAVNPAILLPQTWRYVASYVRGDLLVHHGYPYNGALYVTNVPASPLGVPPTFYLRLLATKVPLVVLAALVPGAIELWRRRQERGFTFLRLLAVLTIVPYSLMAAKFLRYAMPMYAAVDLIAAIGLVSGVRWLLRKQWLPRATRLAVASLAILVFVAGLAAAPLGAAPFYSTFQNGIGERVDPRATAFPEQTYDYGVREAAAAIARVAPPGARVMTDADGVAAEYLRPIRPDLHVGSLSAEGAGPSRSDIFVIVQNEHESFENELIVRQLRASAAPWTQIWMGDLVAAQVFAIPGASR